VAVAVRNVKNKNMNNNTKDSISTVIIIIEHCYIARMSFFPESYKSISGVSTGIEI